MPAGEVHEKDIGTRFIVTIKDEDEAIVDISAATTKEIVFKQYDGTVSTETAILTGNGTDGEMEYASVANFLTPSGKLKYQGFVKLADGSEFHSDIETEIIHPNLN